MNLYLIIKTVHVISATILFGTGLGIAFFMYRSYFTTDIKEKLYAATGTVTADYLFTFPAAITQLTTGLWLVWKSGYHWTSHWLIVTYSLYLLAGLCWLPVVWIQIRLKKILIKSVEQQIPVPAEYHRLFKLWFMLGWPAFLSLIVVFFMMVAKPA